MADTLEKYEEKTSQQVQERPWVKPRVDIHENDDEFLLFADLPGVDRESLKVHLDKEQLSIEARIVESEAGRSLAREYQAVDYRRSFMVPPGIDAAKISADLKNGVLSLHLPKTESLKPRQITVRAGE